MRFIDEAKIFIKAGKGGDGCCSFRREAHEPRGGPDGGNGGQGASIIFQADPQLATLADYRYRKHFEAENGGHGKGKQCDGKWGTDLIIQVPVGTLLKDEHGHLLADLKEPQERFVAAQGGRGGRGNLWFKSSVTQAPRRADPGEAGEEKWIYLELKLLADVGLIGKPNAGKSTLLSKISRAHPKIADYPFTTLTPNLGVVQIDFGRNEPLFSFTVADIPGLIAGAHEGAGLGLEFLRHIERTRLFLHLIDVSDPHEDPLQAYQEIHSELLAYRQDFDQKPEWIVLTKLDAQQDEAQLQQWKQAFTKQKKKLFLISAVTGQGIAELLKELGQWMMQHRKPS